MLARLLVLLLTLAPAPASAQELSAGAGRLHAGNPREATYSWQIGYYQPFTEAWGASFSWLNEGHLRDHHRDGAALQVWRSHRIEGNGLVLAGGLGPYRSFDTVPDGSPRGYQNRHRVGLLWSLRAGYPLADPRLAVFVQLNRVSATPAPQTQAALVGLSMRLDAPPAARSHAAAKPDGEPRNEWAFLFGRTILNSFESETSDLLEAYAVEFRHRAADHLDLTLAYTDEGGIDSARRDGLAAGAWLAARPGPWLLAAGVGPYLYRRFPDPDGSRAGDDAQVKACLRYSMAAGLRLAGRWGARLQWHRTLTRDHRDTDALLAGLAYAW